MVQRLWIQTAWVETKTVKEQKLQVATTENQNNKEITKMQKTRTVKYTLFRPEKTAVKQTANNAKRLARN